MRTFISIDIGMRSYTLVIIDVYDDLKSGCIKKVKSWDLKADCLLKVVKNLS